MVEENETRFPHKGFYDVTVGIGYQWNNSLGTALAYRVIDVEYQEGSFFYDVKQEGWGLSLIRSF
jgi:hypothetical protein